MAFNYLGAGARSVSASAASRAPAKPSFPPFPPSSAVLFAAVTSRNNDSHACATAGWSKIDQQISGPNFTASLWIANGAAAAPTFTWAAPAACSAVIVGYGNTGGPGEAPTIGAILVATGSTAPRLTSGLVTTADYSGVLMLDCCAVNAGLGNVPAWVDDFDSGSATEDQRTTFNSCTEDASGATVPDFSSNGGAAAWVEWQVEILMDPATGTEASKLELAAWTEPQGTRSSKLELAAWLEPKGTRASKLELGAWLGPPIAAAPSGNRRMSLM